MNGELRIGVSEEAVRVVRYATTVLAMSNEEPPDDGGAV